MEIVIIWFLFGLVSMVVATNKNRNGCGWFIGGVLLGPFALVMILVSPALEPKNAIQNKQKKKCPYCAEFIKYEAIVCKHCGRDLSTEPEKEKETIKPPAVAQPAASKPIPPKSKEVDPDVARIRALVASNAAIGTDKPDSTS